MAATITRKLVSIADTADALAVSTRTVRRYIAEGQLEAVRLGDSSDQNWPLLVPRMFPISVSVFENHL